MSWAKKVATPMKTGKSLPPGKVHWDEEVAGRLARKEQAIQDGTYKALDRQCTAETSGKWGPIRRCEQACVTGMQVCYMHIKGSKKTAILKAKRRLVHELEPTISRLVELRDQNEDLKVALGASLKLKDAVMADEKKDSGKPIRKLVIGLAIGALPPQASQTSVALLTAGEQDDEDEAEDGEIVEDDE